VGYVLALVKDWDAEQLRRTVSIPAETPIIVLSSIREAIKVAESIIPDAVLIERELSDGFGIEFVSFLKTYPARLANIPVHVVTVRGKV